MTAWHEDALGVIVEGAVDRFCGRPEWANPYSREYASGAWHAWQLAWREAHVLLEMRGAEEASRWLREAA